METLQSQFKNLDGRIRAKNQNVAQENLNSDLVHGLKKEFLEENSMVKEMFSTEALERYLDSFGDLDENEIKNKKKFFLQTKRKIWSEIEKFPEKERNSDGAQEYIKGFLASKNIYSRIREAINLKKIGGKNMRTPENQNMKVEKQHLDAWTDEEKAQFDEEFKSKQAWKRFENQREKNQIEDETENVGGRSPDSTDVNDGENTVDETFDLDPAENNSNSARQEGALESEGDVIDMEQGADGKWRAEGNVDTKNEQLKSAVDDARRAYTKLHFKTEGISSKVKALFGHINTDQDQDLVNAKNSYYEKLKAFRDARLESINDLPEEEQKALLAELREFDLKEGINLYEDRVAAKAESRGGKIGEYTLKAINQYKKLPTKWKIAMSGALLIGGALAGTGMAAGVFGAATLGKRALAAGVAGVGATGWVEARAQKKESAGIEGSLDQFKNMSPEEQKNLLLSFDNGSLNALENTFHGKIAGRSKRVMLGIGAAASVMALGFVGKAFGAHEAITENTSDIPTDGIEGVLENSRYDSFIGGLNEEVKNTQAFKIFQMQYGDDAYEKFMEESYRVTVNGEMLDTLEEKNSYWNERMNRGMRVFESIVETELLTNTAHDLAQQMGIDNPEKITFTAEAGIPTVINGQLVPENLLTEEQKNAINSIRKLRSDVIGGGTSPLSEKITIAPEGIGDNAVIESSIDNADETIRAATGELQDSSTDAQILEKEYGGMSMADIRDEQARSVAEQQSVDSQLADNPEQVGWDGEGSGISVDREGMGTLTIDKGDSIEGALIAFFKANSDRLTEGGMGWDPNKFKDVNEWAGKRAHGLVEEYMENNPGIDTNMVQPGTTFEIDLNNTADIRINDIDFEGGPHIVPDQEKVVFPEAHESVESPSTAGEKVIESLRTQEEVMQAFNLSREDYNLVRNESASAYVQKAYNVIPDQRMPLDDYLIALSEKETVDLEGKTVGEILESTQINILDQEVASEAVADTAQVASNATWANPDTQTEFGAEAEVSLENLSEREYVQEMSKDPVFKKALAMQIQEATGASSVNEALGGVANRRVDFYLGDKEIGMENQGLKDLRDRAVAAFGDEGKPRPNALTGNYITRIFAKSLREGRLKEVFPSSDFAV